MFNLFKHQFIVLIYIKNEENKNLGDVDSGCTDIRGFIIRINKQWIRDGTLSTFVISPLTNTSGLSETRHAIAIKSAPPSPFL